MAPNGKTPFSLIRKDVVLVKPAQPTPSEVLSFSTIDNDPSLEILCQSIYVYRSNISVSVNENGTHGTRDEASSTDPAIVLKQGLARALVYYHPLAGKLKRQADGTLRVTCNADGVPFAEATVDCSLDSLNYLDGIDPETAQPFVFDWPSETQFFRAMAELASGKSEPTIKPVWKRERLVGIPSQDEPFDLFDMASLAKSPFIPASELCHECFDVDAESIKQLKTRSIDEAGEEMPDVAFTTLEILGAYVWRSRFRALKQDPDGKTILHLALGIRHLVNPPLPAGYYGNAFVSASVVVLGKDLDKGPLFKVARLINRSKRTASEADHITRSLNSSEAFRQRNMKIDGSGASIVLTDWRQLKLLEEVDFGWKESVNMIPIPWNMFGYVNLCIFLPANKINPSMEGGIRVLVSLPGAAMTIFKQEMDALKLKCRGSANKS
ncbi:hypothetical protein Pfo_018363 [Paulownia fortunei]|nr:hypothetical protein Pfo_018363 [Paulownia fortunei]